MILLSSKEIPPQRDTEIMFAEDEGQPEVETQPGYDSQSKNNEGKEQATKKQYMEAEYNTGSKALEKLDRSQYDTSFFLFTVKVLWLVKFSYVIEF